MKSLKTILSVAIMLLFCAVDLSAQEKKNDKRWEITGYFGAGGRGIEGRTLFEFSKEPVDCYGLGIEYFLSPRISLESEINYLPHIAYVVGGGAPWGRSDVSIIEDEIYRILGDINFMFYFDLSESKKPTFIRLFLTLGTGYQYDRVGFTVISLKTLDQHKYGYGEWHFQCIIFGAGFKVRMKEKFSLRLIARIHCFPGEEARTDRLALGLSYRF